MLGFGATWAALRLVCLVSSKRVWWWLPELVLAAGLGTAAVVVAKEEEEADGEKREETTSAAACSATENVDSARRHDAEEKKEEAPAQQQRSSAARYSAKSGLEALAEASPKLPRPLAVELGRLVDFVVRDYVVAWYRTISDDDTFVCDVRSDLSGLLAGVATRCLDRLNLVAFALDTVADAATLQLRAHGEARASARLVGDADNDELERLLRVAETPEERAAAGMIVAAKRRSAATLRRLRESGKLHPAFTWRQRQREDGSSARDDEAAASSNPYELGPGERRYLRHIAARLVRVVAPEEAHACRAVRHLLREVVSNVVLAHAVGAFRPDIVVTLIDSLLTTTDDHQVSPPQSRDGSAVLPEKTATAATIEQQLRESGGVGKDALQTPDEAIVGSEEKDCRGLPAGVAPAGFSLEQNEAWPFFGGEMDTERATDQLAGKGEGAFLVRVDPSLNETQVDRDPTEPLEFVLSYLVNEKEICNVVIFGDPSAGPTFEYVRFGGGRRDPRLVDRASQLADAPPSHSLKDLLNTHFGDVAFRGLELVVPEETTTSSSQPAQTPASNEMHEEHEEESPRKRTPMPHELALDDDAKLFAEQQRHVLLIELQAALEMAEDVAQNVEARVDALCEKHQANAKTAASLERMVLSKDAAERAARKRQADLEKKIVELREAAWRDGDGARRVHRVVMATDAVLQHGGTSVGSNKVDAAMYVAYLLETGPNRVHLHPEAVEAAVLVGASAEDDEQPRLQREAAGIAWIVEALQERCVHSTLYDAASDASLTRTYYGPEAILREPSDAARFLWFAERLDALNLRAPVAILKQYAPVLYCYCHDELMSSKCKNSRQAPPNVTAQAVTQPRSPAPPPDMPSFFPVSGHVARPSTPDLHKAKSSSLLPSAWSESVGGRGVQEQPEDCTSTARTSKRSSSAKSRTSASRLTNDDIVQKSRLSMARASKLERADEKTIAPVRVNFLLRRRPSKSALLDRGLLPRKRVGPAQLARVQMEEAFVAESTAEVSRSTSDKQNGGGNFLESLQTAGSQILLAGAAAAASPLQTKTTYYRIWLLAPVNVISDDVATKVEGISSPDLVKTSAPIVIPVSRGRAYARRRYRDFRALRSALCKAMSQERAATLPVLPGRRLAERLYSRGDESRRVGLERFLVELLRDPALRESHELRVFMFSRRDDMRRVLNTLGSDDGDNDDRRISVDRGGSPTSLSNSGSVVDDDDDEDEEEEEEEDDDYDDDLLGDFSPSAINHVTLSNESKTMKTKEAAPPPVPQQPPPPPVSEASDAIGGVTPSVAPADWRRLKRVEHRTYMLLRELFDVDHMGMMRRNFVALLRRGARALWSPAMATWLGERAVREARVKLIASLTYRLNDLVWPGGKPRPTNVGNVDIHDPANAAAVSDRARLEAAVAAAALRDRLAAAIPSSLASLVGQSSTDDAVSKLHELILCPIQLRSLAYALLDLLLVEVCPELELAVGGLDHLIS